MAKIDFTRERTYGKSFDGILKLQEHVASEANLPLSAEKGDIYSVGEDKILYMFDGDSFTKMGEGEISVAADITALTDDQLDALNVGDKVAKKTGTAQHLYVVSYKDAENGGLCLTYTDASTVETVSYDHTESGWAYNSTDKTNIGYNPLADSFIDVGEMPGSQFKEINAELANKIEAKGLLLKSGEDYYARTSDYLCDNGQIVSSAVAALEQSVRPEEIYGVFGYVTWPYNDMSDVGGANLIILFTYDGGDQITHYGLLSAGL